MTTTETEGETQPQRLVREAKERIAEIDEDIVRFRDDRQAIDNGIRLLREERRTLTPFLRKPKARKPRASTEAKE